MAYDLQNRLVIGVSARTLFHLEKENSIFEQKGVKAYCDYQISHEKDILEPGPGFQLIKALLRWGSASEKEEQKNSVMTEVIIMSRNSPDASLRIFNSIRHYGLHITRAVLTGGASPVPYLKALHTDLFLSANEEDVRSAAQCSVAAGLICVDGRTSYPMEEIRQIRMAFDGDSVLFSGDSEKIFQEKGLQAFEENERLQAESPLREGPFARLLRKITVLQQSLQEGGEQPFYTALVTSRSAPAHERVIRTLRSWGICTDEVFFLGGIEKKEILKAFGAHVFFDDQAVHTGPASQVVFSVKVPDFSFLQEKMQKKAGTGPGRNGSRAAEYAEDAG